jgi:HEAT repeat protein
MLADGDAERAGRAVFAMANSPTSSLPTLRAHLKPVSVTPESINQLVGQLDHPRFAEREKAAKELGLLGPVTASALKAKLAGKPSLEVVTRIEKLLADLNAVRPTADQVRELRSLEVLERIGTSQAADFLRELASGTAGAPVTWQAAESLRRVGDRQDK